MVASHDGTIWAWSSFEGDCAIVDIRALLRAWLHRVLRNGVTGEDGNAFVYL